MALSSVAERVYSKLGDRPANCGSLTKKLDLDDVELGRAIVELTVAGLVEREGKRVRRASFAGAGDLSINATHILARLPADASSIGGLRLRGQVDLPDEDYRMAIDELKAKDIVKVGPGRGGTVARIEHVAPVTPEDASILVEREECLYEPFKSWLLSSLQTQSLVFAHAAVTASPKGRRRKSGKWSRPDVTSVEVWSSEWLPGAVLTVSAFEIKRASDATQLESVYEAKAHGRWADKCSLVIEVDPGSKSELGDDLLGEIERFELGLYTMQIRDNGSYKIEQEVEPQDQHPDPALKAELLEHYFELNGSERDAFKGQIGR